MPSLVPYVAPLVVAAALCGMFLAAAVPHRSVPGMRWFMVFMGALVVWTLAYAGEILVPSLEGKVLAARIQYLGISLVGVSWLGFATEYTGLSWWSPRNVALALAVPAVTLVLIWTNDAHLLVWSAVSLSRGRPYTVLDLGHGPWFWVQVSYSYLCILVVMGLLLRTVLVRGQLFRGQAGLLFLACLPPLAGNAIYVAGLADTDLDLTVFGFSLSGLLAGWAILRWKLLSIGPIARDTIVEGMSEPVAVIDPRGRVVDVNPAALTILGTTADRLIGWSAREALGAFAPDLGQEGGGRRTVRSPSDGRSYDCELDPLQDSKGRRRGWTLVLHDVTERAAEAEALRRAREVAEDTALAQRAFLTNMNHELRTPLNGVMGMLQVLMQTELTEEQRGFAGMAYSSGEELLALVDRVMDFSAIEMGRLELTEEPFDLGAAVRRALEGLQGEATAKGLALRLEMGPEVPVRVTGDGFRLGQVVSSLVDNAVKFTARGGVEVRVTAPSRTEDAVRVRVEVKDTGIGIPAGRLEAVFEGFVQADSSSTRRHQGAGLGLTIAQRLVVRMGGHLEVVSEEGRGSTFWFEVPLRPAPRGQPAD
ncbi:MAG: histidine kinase N-terminal 7TM domain-containing protein [Longimicrobiales bacterium]|nr:histidine kinase N-terminal 7TM domain-containing protein [Longimicrobiales bacterium]